MRRSLGEKKKTLHKYDLVELLAEKGYTKHSCSVIIDDFFTVLEEAFVRGDDITIKGFGKFEVRTLGERTTYHPLTREPYVIPERTTVKFLPGGRLKEELINGWVRN